MVTGGREYKDKECIEKTLDLLKDLDFKKCEVIHGACQGADTLFTETAFLRGMNELAFPADWTKYGPKAGPIRNKLMVDTHPDIICIFHEDIKTSKGTLGCVKYVLQQISDKWKPLLIFNGVFITSEKLKECIK